MAEIQTTRTKSWQNYVGKMINIALKENDFKYYLWYFDILLCSWLARNVHQTASTKTTTLTDSLFQPNSD